MLLNLGYLGYDAKFALKRVARSTTFLYCNFSVGFLVRKNGCSEISDSGPGCRRLDGGICASRGMRCDKFLINHSCSCVQCPTTTRRALVIAADETIQTKNYLTSMGQFQVVDTFDARYNTPSLALLNTYSAVFIWSNYYFQNNVLMGDVLADYAAQGYLEHLSCMCALTLDV